LVKENVQAESDALWQIAMAASGSMRDALTLTDQAISFCEGSVLTEGVTQMLGVPPQQQIVKLLEAMASRDVSHVVDLVQTIGEQTPDYHHTLDALLSMLHRVALAQVAPDAVDNSVGDLEKVLNLASLLTAEDVQLYYQIGIKGLEDLKLAVEMRSAFEMVLLRMLVFSPNYTEPAREAAITESVTSSASEKKKPTITKTEASLDPETGNTEKGNNSHSTLTPQLESDSTSETVIDKKGAAVEITPSNWINVFQNLELTGISANIMANCELITASDETLTFLLATEQSAVFSEDAPRKIAPAFEKYLGKKVSVEITIGEITGETPAARKIRLNQEMQAKRIREFENDWPVLELKQKFGGRVVIESIVEGDAKH